MSAVLRSPQTRDHLGRLCQYRRLVQWSRTFKGSLNSRALQSKNRIKLCLERPLRHSEATTQLLFAFGNAKWPMEARVWPPICLLGRQNSSSLYLEKGAPIQGKL